MNNIDIKIIEIAIQISNRLYKTKSLFLIRIRKETIPVNCITDKVAPATETNPRALRLISDPKFALYKINELKNSLILGKKYDPTVKKACKRTDRLTKNKKSFFLKLFFFSISGANIPYIVKYVNLPSWVVSFEYKYCMKEMDIIRINAKKNQRLAPKKVRENLHPDINQDIAVNNVNEKKTIREVVKPGINLKLISNKRKKIKIKKRIRINTNFIL